MTLVDELQMRTPQVEETQEFTSIPLLNLAHARQQVANAAEAVADGSTRIQARLAKVWATLLPIKREDIANDKLWADLVAIMNRMVFYNPSGRRPNRMKASLSSMRDHHASALKEMICRLDAEVRATA
jgi:type II secretory pathway component PulM